MVERAGMKLQDLLVKDPWKGKDCGRENCFPCTTKLRKEKGSMKDCTKRNLIYEIKCTTCEEKAHKQIEDEFEDAEIVKERKKEARLYKYIGETSRSAYERGFEHLDKLASLSTQSMMLRHMVDQHEGEDMGKVKWDMEIKEFKKSAFERQIKEGVLIQRESEKHNILNSKSEWNQSTIPRLATRVKTKNYGRWKQNYKEKGQRRQNLRERSD